MRLTQDAEYRFNSIKGTIKTLALVVAEVAHRSFNSIKGTIKT